MTDISFTTDRHSDPINMSDFSQNDRVSANITLVMVKDNKEWEMVISGQGFVRELYQDATDKADSEPVITTLFLTNNSGP